MKRIAIAAVKFYRRFISKQKPNAGCCRFIPTCSEYSLEAFERFGFLKGGALTLRRLVKCNPLFKGGFDPVPEKRTKPLKTDNKTKKAFGKYKHRA